MLSTICRPAARLQALGCRPSYTAQPAIIRMPAFHRLGTEELLGWNIAAGAYELTRGIHDLIKPAAPCPVKDPPGEHPGNRTDKGNSLPGVDEAMRGGDSSLLGKLFSVVNDTVRAVAGDSELARYCPSRAAVVL